MTRTASKRTAGSDAISITYVPAVTPPVGLTVGRETPQAFAAAKPTGVTLENPEAYRFVSADRPGQGEADLMESSPLSPHE